MLIVDDEERILLAVGDYFDFYGYDVALAHELNGAKRLLDLHEYDVILADLRLTGIDGWEGLDLISYAREKSASAKIVLLTAYGTKEIVAEAYGRGADAFLAKPQPLADIALLVRSLLTPSNESKGEPIHVAKDPRR